MKKGWEYKSLNDLCSIVGRIGFRGYTKEDLVSNPNDGAITLSPSNIVDGELVFSKCSYINWKKYEESPEIMLKSGDVVLVKTASIGKCAVVRNLPHKATLNPQFVVLKDLKVNPEFITYYLKTPSTQSQIVKMAGGVAIPTLSQKKLGTLNIPIPPLSEQKEIVEYLDSSFAKIDKLKENAAKNLEEAKALFQSALKDALEPKEGWEEKTLGELGSLKNGMNFTKNESGTELHILGVGDFGNLFSISNTENLPIISLNEIPSDDYMLENEDIVFVRSNGNKNLVGRCVLVYPNNIKTSFSGFCIRFRKNSSKIDAKYLTYFLKAPNTRKKIAGNGANISNLNQKVLQSLAIPFPSLQEQQSIVSLLDSLNEKLNTLQQNYSRICNECDALKQAILRQVFE